MKKIKYILIGIVVIAILLLTTCSADPPMTRKKICSSCEAYLPSVGPVLEVTTDKEVYTQGETVQIFLTNVGDETLSGGGPIITIYNEDNEIVYQLGAYCWVELEPSEYIDWWPPWDQTDQQGDQVPVGAYVVEGFLSGFEEDYIDDFTFYIVN